MTRSELISRIAMTHRDLSYAQIEGIVCSIFDAISNGLSAGKRVELRGFGIFSLRNREARTGRNPRTGDSVHVAGKAVPFFKAGKELRTTINEG